MSRRLTVITEIIAPYRIPVFNALAERGDIDLHVIFLAETDPTQREWQVYRDEIRFSYEVLPGLRKRIREQNLLLNWGVVKALNRAAPDAIVCGGYNYVASWVSLRWAERNQVPLYLWAESTSKNFRSGYRWMESLKANFLERCAGFIVPGQASLRYLEAYGVSRDNVFLAPNAVDNALFKGQRDLAQQNRDSIRTSLGLPGRYFLSAGRLVREKGIFDLLQAYSNLNSDLKREVGLVFAGDGPERDNLERAAVEESGRIVFAGFAHRETLAIYYSLADAFVFPTYADAWGLVVNEAMACGLPIICSDAAGCSEDLVVNGRNGYIFTAGNVTQLTTAMEETVSAETSRAQMGKSSQQKIREFSPEVCAAGIAGAIFSQEACVA